jgi:hypothetical protein
MSALDNRPMMMKSLAKVLVGKIEALGKLLVTLNLESREQV